jgi:hypothetical protein
MHMEPHFPPHQLHNLSIQGFNARPFHPAIGLSLIFLTQIEKKQRWRNQTSFHLSENQWARTRQGRQWVA